MRVELAQVVMDVEQTFDVRLSADISTLATVGQLHDAVAKALSERPDPAQSEPYVYDMLCRALESLPGVDRRQVQPSNRSRGGGGLVHFSADCRNFHKQPLSENMDLSPSFPPRERLLQPTTLLREIIPLWPRRRIWKRLDQSLPLFLPPLHRPKLVGWLIAIAAIGLAWLCTFGPVNPKWVTVKPAGAIICLFFIGPLAAFFGVVGHRLTTPLALVWDREIQTLADLAKAVLALNRAELSRPRKPWTDEEIWTALRQAVADVLGVDADRVTSQSLFGEDLAANSRGLTAPGEKR